MSLKTLAASSSLEGANFLEMYEDFRRRVDEKRDAAGRLTDAFEDQNSDIFYDIANSNLGDGAFDQALHDAFAAGDIESSLYHSMMYTLLEAASAAGVEGDGDTVVVTEIFALPVTGTIDEIPEASGNLGTLREMARAFSTTGYVSEGVRVLLSPTTIDPLAASKLRPAVARQIAHEFQSAFDAEYDQAAAERLFEMVQAPFEFMADDGRNHMDDKGTVTRFVIGATQRVLSTVHPTSADAFLSNMLDEPSTPEVAARSEAFIEAVNSSPHVLATIHAPFPIARATAFAAIAEIGDKLNTEATFLGIQRPDRMMDEIVLTRSGGFVYAEGVIGSAILGPCAVPEELVLRDDRWFVNSLALLGDELSEREAMVISRTRAN